MRNVVLDSSAVEHPAVNRRVVGSNPTRGVFVIYADVAQLSFRQFICKANQLQAELLITNQLQIRMVE